MILTSMHAFTHIHTCMILGHTSTHTHKPYTCIPIHTYTYIQTCIHTCTHREKYEYQEVEITGSHLSSCLTWEQSHEEAHLDSSLAFLRQEASVFLAPFLGSIIAAGDFTSRMMHHMANKLVLAEWVLSYGHGSGILWSSLPVPWASSQQGGWVFRAVM